MGELASIEEGTSSLKRTSVDLPALLNDTVAGLPEVPDLEVNVQLTCDETCAINGDPSRLKSAFTSLLWALRRELVSGDTLHVRQSTRENAGQAVAWVAFGDADNIDRLQRADPASLETFDEWRGGCGLGLPIARRVIAAHDGRLWSAGVQPRAGAVVMLPCS
jgi:signal transduction histidine kinase